MREKSFVSGLLYCMKDEINGCDFLKSQWHNLQILQHRNIKIDDNFLIDIEI